MTHAQGLDGSGSFERRGAHVDSAEQTMKTAASSRRLDQYSSTAACSPNATASVFARPKQSEMRPHTGRESPLRMRSAWSATTSEAASMENASACQRRRWGTQSPSL